MKKIYTVILFSMSFHAWSGGQVVCVGQEQYVAWPDAANPVWEMCYVEPEFSSANRGSSLEIKNVHYNGHLVLERSHVPMLFANYTTSTCYRDWKDDPASFIAADRVDNPTEPAITTCDASTMPDTPVFNCPFGLDGSNGCINGVQVEKYNDRLLLTTNHAASWYKYTARYIFHADGRIQPRFGFGNSDGTLDNTKHWHHAYWRMNFDINGLDNDKIYIVDSQGETEQVTEFSDLRELFNAANDTSIYTDEVTWLIKDSVTNRGYRVVAGQGGVSADGGIDDYAVLADESNAGYHKVDVMASKYKLFNNGMPEYADTTSNSLLDCDMEEENIVGEIGSISNEPESLVGEDVVFWYRAAVVDIPVSDGGAALLCKTAGPTLYPVGDWSSGQEPVAVQDVVSVTENTIDNVIDVLSNDTDVDGGPKFVTGVTQPNDGVVSIDVGGTQLLYTPSQNYCNEGVGTDDFTYTLNGGASANVEVTVLCVDSLPAAVLDAVAVDENVVDAQLDVLMNDTDVDGGPKFIDSVTQPVNGTVVIGMAGSYLEYTPVMDYCNDGQPTDDFTYSLNGGSEATVQVTVNCLGPSDVIFEDGFE